MTGYEPARFWDGHPLQAGMPRYRGDNLPHAIDSTYGFIVRAVVLATRYADEDARIDNGELFSSQTTVLCDVRTMDRYQRKLTNVPVMQHVAGIHDQDLYVPRPMTIDTGGAAVNTDPQTGAVTPAENGDGDIVTVAFLENSPRRPVILPFTLGHPQARRRPERADGRVRRIRHAGCTIEWSEDGNLTIDATTGAAAALSTSGAEQAGGRALRLDGEAVYIGGTSAQATEPFVCGTQWQSIMLSILEAISQITVNTAVGPSTPPVNFARFAPGGDLYTSIANNEQLSNFIFGRKSR